MKSYICPFCHKLVKGGHLNFCKERPAGISNDDAKIMYIEYNTYKGVCQDIINDYQNLSSLPELKEKYDLDYKNIRFILKYHDIHIRTLSESAYKITAGKIKETCKIKYNTVNPSQVDSVKEKKCQTFMKHYGADNIWKTDEYAKFTSERWKSYTEEEKFEIINKGRTTREDINISGLERHVIDLFNEINIDIATQFKFPDYYHRYDIKIRNLPLIFEVNGDFWHANPKYYKYDDEVNFGHDCYTAGYIWNKDSQHVIQAMKHGCTVINLWEDFLNSNSDNEIKQHIIYMISNYI